MKHIIKWFLLMILVTPASLPIHAQTALDSQGFADNYPGNRLQLSGADEDMGALDSVFNLSLGNTSNQFKVISEDDEFRYRKYGTAIYREFKKPQPRMSYADSRPIPRAPLFWVGHFEFYSDESEPARPNCSERSFRYDDYMRLVNDPSVKTKADFLRKIPTDTLQKFTFIHKSKSLQRAGVSKLTPRIMRFSTDGKFIMTYTTNPEFGNYNSVEVIYFDDQTRRYNFLHSEFLNESEIQNESKRVHTIQNPKSCFSCHGGMDPRPNWAMYASWPGVYGDNDDVITNSEEANLKDYQSMRTHLAETPELQTLPWPKKSSNLYSFFPYVLIEKEPNYNLRPNAHFTIISSRLNAQRLARKFEESPIFPKVKWSLLAEGLECEIPENPIFKSLNDFNTVQKISSRGRPSRPYQSERPFQSEKYRGLKLYHRGNQLNFMNTDWSLEFNESPGRNYSYYHTAQWEMSDFVLSVLFRNLSKQEPELIPYDVRINRMSNLFGKNFMCVDEISDKLWRTDKSQQKICEILERKVKSEIESLVPSDFELVKLVKNEVWPERIWEETMFASVSYGRSIVSNTCANCHQDRSIPFNFKSMDLFSKNQNPASKLAIIKLIEQRLGNEKHCNMPKPISGICLTDKQRNSVIKYLESL